MAWTEKQIKQFQMDNNIQLEELNKTLRPDNNLKEKVGCFIHGQVGDLSTIMSVLKYRDIVFPNKKIIFYTNFPNADLLRYAPISEVRPWLWAGNGLPAGCPDYYPMLCDSNNRLNKELAAKFAGTADLEGGYFPAPHMVSGEKRNGINYPNVSKMIFGIDSSKEWHPLLSFSEEEKEMAKEFIQKLPPGKIIMFETFCGSGQSQLTHDMVIRTMQRCNTIWGNCNFIFTSHKYLNSQYSFPETLFNGEIISAFSAAQFTPRQCALLANYCDLFISTSSGITVTCSCWGNKNFPILQYCGSAVCGTKEIANGEIVQVFSDYRPIADSQNEFYDKLTYLLNKYQNV